MDLAHTSSRPSATPVGHIPVVRISKPLRVSVGLSIRKVKIDAPAAGRSYGVEELAMCPPSAAFLSADAISR